MEVLAGVGAPKFAPQASLLGKVHRGRRISLVAVLRALGCGTHNLGTQSGVTGVQRPPKLNQEAATFSRTSGELGSFLGMCGGEPPF